MNVLHLKYMVEVAKAGSITLAAERLFMNQPNLSKAIKDLEASVGIEIFRRTSKGMDASADVAQTYLSTSARPSFKTAYRYMIIDISLSNRKRCHKMIFIVLNIRKARRKQRRQRCDHPSRDSRPVRVERGDARRVRADRDYPRGDTVRYTMMPDSERPTKTTSGFFPKFLRLSALPGYAKLV